MTRPSFEINRNKDRRQRGFESVDNAPRVPVSPAPYLVEIDTGRVHNWSESLAQRSDMVEACYNLEGSRDPADAPDGWNPGGLIPVNKPPVLTPAERLQQQQAEQVVKPSESVDQVKAKPQKPKGAKGKGAKGTKAAAETTAPAAPPATPEPEATTTLDVDFGAMSSPLAESQEPPAASTEQSFEDKLAAAARELDEEE